MAKKKVNDENSQVLTQEGYDKLLSELEERKDKIRKDIAGKLELATEQGDLSENAAYKTALEEKELNENKISELEEILANAEIREDDEGTSSVTLGNTVKVRLGTGKPQEFTVVGQSETDPVSGKISVESPIIVAIYGKPKGFKGMVKLPVGEQPVEVLEIK